MNNQIHTQLEALGLRCDYRFMPNGEHRISLASTGPDGSAYIRTILPEDSPAAWQNAHFHGGPNARTTRKGLRETTVVQKGWVIYAEERNGGRTVCLMESGDIWTSQPGIPHNVMMGPGAEIHTVKFGEPVGNDDEYRKGADWWPASPQFDAWTKGLTEAEARRLAGLAEAGGGETIMA